MKTSYPLEKFIGMEYYSTSFSGVGGKLKQRYEDFIVEEIDPSGEIVAADVPLNESCLPQTLTIGGTPKKSRNIHFKLQKMGLTTIDAVSLLASSLRISRHLVTYCGLKDKRALTAQRMSIPKSALDALTHVNLSRVWLREFTYSRSPLSIGDLWGNRFSIIVRNIDSPCEAALPLAEELRSSTLLNYFGVQRFGVSRPISHIVGKALLKRDYETAVKCLLFAEFESDVTFDEDLQLQNCNVEITESLLSSLPSDMRYERDIVKALLRNPNDYETAFSKTPPRIQTLFIHAYQSYLFNRILSLRFARGISLDTPLPGDFLIRLDESHTGRDDWLFVTEQNSPKSEELVASGRYGLAGIIPGYASKLPNSLQTDLVREILTDEGIQLSQFHNTDNPHLDSPGGLHLLTNKIPDLRCSCDDRDLKLEFSLRKGAYATVVLRELMKNDPLNRA